MKCFRKLLTSETKHIFVNFQGLSILLLVCFRQSDVKRIWWLRLHRFSSRVTSHYASNPETVSPNFVSGSTLAAQNQQQVV